MLKLVFLVRRKAGTDSEAFRAYWKDKHAGIAKELPGLRRYVQNHAVMTSGDAPPPFDGFAEMWWDDAEAMQRSLASPEGEAAVADAATFIDVDSMLTFAVEQVEIL